MKSFFVKKILILLGIIFLNIPFAQAETAEEYLRDGNDSFRIRNYDQAIFDYSKAIEGNPNLGKAYNNRGVTYALEGSLKRAIADFTMAIADNLNDAEGYNNRGHAYAEEGNLLQAIIDFSRAIDINPLYTKAYKNRAYAYYQSKMYDKAWSDVFKIEELGGGVDHDFYHALKQVSGKA